MLKRFRLVGVCLVVVFAVGVVGVSSASAAAPGPYFKNGAGVLGEGQTVALKAKMKAGTSGKLYMFGPLDGLGVTCTAASGEGKAYNEYVKGVLKEGRLKEAKVVLEGCEVEPSQDEPSECEINGGTLGNGTIAFEHALGRLGYSPGATEKEREEGKGVEGLVYPEAGKTYGNLKFSGTCSLPGTKWALTGEVIWAGEPINALSKTLTVRAKVTGEHAQELKQINFPEFAETLTGQELKFGANNMSLSGELELAPLAGEELGVFT